MSDTITAHFVTFYSPGTFVAEETVRPIDSWDVDRACSMAREIVERYGATPFGFRFYTRTRGPEDLDSKVSARSAMYYLGGKIETLEEIEARNDPRDEILLFNMRANGYDQVLVNTNSWKYTTHLEPDDVVLDWQTAQKGETRAQA